MNSSSIQRILPLMVLFLLTASCAGTSAPARDNYYYTLNYPPPAPPFEHTLPFVLRVDHFISSPPFNSQSIIFADQGLYRNAYARHHWIAPPAELLAFLLARDLKSARVLQAVLPPDSFAASTHILNGWLEEILEVDLPDGWLASLRLSITLIASREADPSRRIIFQKIYAASAPIGERSPAGMAEAMSTAAAQVSAEVVRDVYQALMKP